jgi:hypothetical protein
MQWSKLKKMIEERICDSLKDAVDLHATSYRDTYNVTGRYWITVDGERVFSAYTARDSGAYWETASSGAIDLGDETTDGVARERPELSGRDAHHRFTETLERYLSLSIDDALSDPNELIRALAMIDRRLGTRRLRSMEIADDEHPLVRYMYELRVSR